MTAKQRTWSKYQQAIFDVVDSRESFVVNAVAGSGKTTTLEETCRRAGYHCGLVAFNRRIKQELAARLPENEVLTCHGLGFRTLADKRKVVLDTEKYKDTIKETAAALSSSISGPLVGRRSFTKRLETTAKLRSAFDLSRLSAEDDFATVANTYQLDVEEEEYPEYQKALDFLKGWGAEQFLSNGKVDFGDMIWLPLSLGLSPPSYDLVLVDELQDLSGAQHQLIKKASSRFIGVGDPAQSIYLFAGALPGSFSEFASAVKAAELPLSICYRCPEPVVGLARSWVPQIEASSAHPGGTTEHLSYFAALDTIKLGDMVLARGNRRAVRTAIHLLRTGRPAVVVGQDTERKILSLVSDAGGPWSNMRETVLALANKRADALIAKEKPGAAQAVLDLAEAAVALRDGLDARTEDEFILGVKTLFLEKADAIKVSSIHRAKGLESERVFILDWPRLPLKWKDQTDQEAEQERNLCYVAVTRATRHLFLVGLEPE